MIETVAVCVSTFRRPEGLRRLLASLSAMDPPPGVSVELRVADNDTDRSAEPIAWDEAIPFGVRYTSVAERGVAATRNAAVEMGAADWIAFVDDDERVERCWLVELLEAAHSTGADAVFGPVVPEFETPPPRWAVSGRFFEHVSPAGGSLHWKHTRTGNALVRGAWFSEHGFRFDSRFGRSGGEDTELFARMARFGAVYRAAPRALVFESVPAARVSVRGLAARWRRGGRNFQRVARMHGGGHHPALALVGRLVCAAAAAPTGPSGLVRARCRLALALGGLEGWLLGAGRGPRAYG